MSKAKSTQDLRLDRFFDGIAKSMTVRLACKYAGISKSAWYAWLEDERMNGEDSPHYGLQARYDLADGERAYALLSEVHDRIRLDKKNSMLLVWLLGRLYHDEYGNSDIQPQVNVMLDDNSVNKRIKDAIDKVKAANVADKPKAKKVK